MNYLTIYKCTEKYRTGSKNKPDRAHFFLASSKCQSKLFSSDENLPQRLLLIFILSLSKFAIYVLAHVYEIPCKWDFSILDVSTFDNSPFPQIPAPSVGLGKWQSSGAHSQNPDFRCTLQKWIYFFPWPGRYYSLGREIVFSFQVLRITFHIIVKI